MGTPKDANIRTFVRNCQGVRSRAIAFQQLCRCEEGVSPTKQSPSLRGITYPAGMLRDQAGKAPALATTHSLFLFDHSKCDCSEGCSLPRTRRPVMKNRGGVMERLTRLLTGFVLLLKRTMSPEAGFSGFVETGPAAAAYSNPH